MTLSRRFASILIVLLLVTGALVIRAVGGRVQLDECRDPEALKRLDLVPGTQKASQREWRLTSRRRQWTLGTAGAGSYNDPRIGVRMVRDFELFSLWLHPTEAMVGSFVPDEERLRWIDTSAGRLAVHLEYKYVGARPKLVAYAYLYGLDPVANPATAALLDAFRAVVGGTRPLTQLLAGGTAYRDQLPQLEAGCLRWLAAAFERYREVCGP